MEPNAGDFNLGHFLIEIYFDTLCHTRNSIMKSFEKKNMKFKKKENIYSYFFLKNCVGCKFSEVFCLEKTMLDRIPRCRKTALKEE